MKFKQLLIGLMLGGLLGVGLTKYFVQNKPQTKKTITIASSPSSAKWPYADSLDAVKAAPGSHEIVYEDSTVRILRVVLEANKTEPVHTHQWKSIMWFTQATPMKYYRYALKNNKYVVQDSIVIPRMPPEVLNHGDAVAAEEPHAIKNLSNQQGIAYRVEFKKDFKP